MEAWFLKSVMATVSIVPTFIAIPFFKSRFGVDPLVFLVWYFGASAATIAAYWAISGRAAELAPPLPIIIAVVAIGAVFGSFANGSLFQAVGLAPNPGLPPVIYATASVMVFFLSATLAATLPDLFRPVSTELSRVGGIVLVLIGLYFLAGGKIANPF